METNWSLDATYALGILWPKYPLRYFCLLGRMGEIFNRVEGMLRLSSRGLGFVVVGEHFDVIGLQLK